jgi:hypothetical protein
LEVTEPSDVASVDVLRLITFSGDAGIYTVMGYPARLYTSAFGYNDTEVIYVPPNIQHMTVAYEDRSIMISSNDNIEELEEYREAVTRNRMRAT